MKPTVTAHDDELIYAWSELGVGLAMTKLRETDTGTVRAHVVIQSLRPEAAGHIYWGLVTLSSATDRKTVISKLEGFAPREGGWERDIDRTFFDAYERHVQVPHAVDLADVQASIDTEFLFKPTVPHGQITLFLADQGSTKSYLMEYLGLCCATGQPSVFGPPNEVAATVYFDWEVDERVARRRLEWIARGMGLGGVPRGLHYLNMSERGRLVDRIREMRHEVQRLEAGLVIIDSLTFATGGDLNSAEYSAPTMSAIGSLGDGVTKLVSAHPNKASRKDDADISVIGSGLFEFRARAIWLLRREKDKKHTFNVSMTPRKPFDGIPPQTLAYRVRFESGEHAVHFEQAQIEESWELAQKSLSLSERIRLALQRGSANTLELALQTSSSADAVRRECSRMQDVIALTAGGGMGKTTVWGLRYDGMA